MKISSIIIIGYICISKIAADETCDITIPKDLKIGASTASFQIEGAWNVSGKGLSIWDTWTHECPECITDGNNIEDTCQSYYKYKEDVAIMKDIGLDHYRFSISWPRILSTGLVNKINNVGIEYYKNVTNELINNGIVPIVTIHHFDVPQALQDMGGWTNKKMVDWFADYARIIFRKLGPLVKTFITINEPTQLCTGYKSQTMAPGIKTTDDIGYYLCIHNTLKAHARAYHIYDKEFRESQNGKVGLAAACQGWVLDESNDMISADTYFQFNCGIVTHPIFKGDYPQIVKERMALVSKARGYTVSRLPTFSPEWISRINGTADFFGLNHYTSFILSPDLKETDGTYNSDSGIVTSTNSNWTHSSWINDVPEGFGNLLRKIKCEYDNPVVYVLENGISDGNDSLWDYGRIRYHHGYLRELLLAKERDGCNIQKYTVWSIIDNFELSSGYSQRFGIVHVDFDSPNKTRTPKFSASWWNEVLTTRQLSDISIDALLLMFLNHL